MGRDTIFGLFFCMILVSGCQATENECQTPIELTGSTVGQPGQAPFNPADGDQYVEFTLPATYNIYSATGDSSEDFTVEFTNMFGSGQFQVKSKTYHLQPELATKVRVRANSSVSNIVIKGCKLNLPPFP